MQNTCDRKDRGLKLRAAEAAVGALLNGSASERAFPLPASFIGPNMSITSSSSCLSAHFHVACMRPNALLVVLAESTSRPCNFDASITSIGGKPLVWACLPLLLGNCVRLQTH